MAGFCCSQLGIHNYFLMEATTARASERQQLVLVGFNDRSSASIRCQPPHKLCPAPDTPSNLNLLLSIHRASCVFPACQAAVNQDGPLNMETVSIVPALDTHPGRLLPYLAIHGHISSSSHYCIFHCFGLNDEQFLGSNNASYYYKWILNCLNEPRETWNLICTTHYSLQTFPRSYIQH